MSDYIDSSVAVQRLTRDLANGARKMTVNEARFLVDYYYICQDDRIRFKGQVRALDKSEEPNMVLGYLAEQSEVLESQVKRALDKYTDEHPIGKWIKSLYGFGPVLAAGFVAHIDIEKAPTAGHIWSYAGLLPERKWEKGQKRPWNAELKKLVWKAGECMVKFSNKEECVYGTIFRERKDQEWVNNLAGAFAHQAIKEQEKYAANTESYGWVHGCYKAEDIKKLQAGGIALTPDNLKKIKGEKGSGTCMLPPAHIHARARRYCMKIFLSHLHEVWYETHFKCRVPNPFVIEHMGHVHRIKVPNYDSPYAGNQPAAVFKVKKD